MSNPNHLVILTDAAPDAMTSTSREVIDLLAECKKKNLSTIVMTARSVNEIKYLDATIAIYAKAPFYKSKSHILRLISENLLSLALIFHFFCRFGFKVNIRGVVWISPSIFNLWAALFLKLVYRARIYLVLRDLFPFWLSNVGIIKTNGIVFHLLKLIADLQMHTSDRIGVESPSTVNFFKENYPNYLPKVEVLWNWMNVIDYDKYQPNMQNIRFVYAGNFGKAQGSEMFLALCERFRDDLNIEIHFIGRGDDYAKIVSFKNDHNIENLYIHNQLPPEEIDFFLRLNSIGLVFLRPDLKTSNIPGKFMSYVLNGLPVLASVNLENDLLEIIPQFNMGKVNTSADKNVFLNVAEAMVADYKNSIYDSGSIVSHAQDLFSTQKAFTQIECFLN
jgi:glycosyltransferase involved in cell wall biosynthesis